MILNAIAKKSRLEQSISLEKKWISLQMLWLKNTLQFSKTCSKKHSAFFKESSTNSIRLRGENPEVI